MVCYVHVHTCPIQYRFSALSAKSIENIYPLYILLRPLHTSDVFAAFYLTTPNIRVCQLAIQQNCVLDAVARETAVTSSQSALRARGGRVYVLEPSAASHRLGLHAQR